jgi:hypothetical protein
MDAMELIAVTKGSNRAMLGNGIVTPPRKLPSPRSSIDWRPLAHGSHPRKTTWSSQGFPGRHSIFRLARA